MRNQCKECKKSYPTSQLTFDRKLGSWYAQGVCLNCYPSVLGKRTLHCVECHLPFIMSHGYPSNMCHLCRIRDIGLQAEVVRVTLMRKVDGTAFKNLTVDEWMSTLMFFDGLCAYCQLRPYECLEHFVPLSWGAGTCKSNVVPSCLSCNTYKKNLHPEQVTSIPKEAIQRVRAYLESL